MSVPALVITAEDDPFVPSAPFHDPKVTDNPHIDLRISAHGGHCGFVGVSSPNDDGYWAENQIVDFISRQAQFQTGSLDDAERGTGHAESIVVGR